jgi:uncharacterized protein YuzE
MKVDYFPETDTLYIGLTDGPSTESEEVAPGVVIDLDANGAIVGIEIDPASSVTNPKLLETNLPVAPLPTA